MTRFLKLLIAPLPLRHGMTLTLTVLSLCPALILHAENAHHQLVCFDSFANFSVTTNPASNEVLLTSPKIMAAFEADQAIPSWNVSFGAEDYLKVDLRPIYPDRTSKSYNLGFWVTPESKRERQSFSKQGDANGDVSTDTLMLKNPSRQFEMRLTVGPVAGWQKKLKRLTLCLSDTRTISEVKPPNRNAWGKLIEVPEKSQMAYPNGNVLCSPTTVSMLLNWWAGSLKRSELKLDVPDVIKGVYDPHFGAGNWAFNTAFAGSFDGMTSYVSRFSGVSEIEDWIEQGIPVGLSLCYNRLRGKTGRYSGHLVVCVGFNKEGDPIINDPGTSKNVRKTFTRANLTTAWAYSHNSVYLVYPQGQKLPGGDKEHWCR
jgi:hypothetical protein